MKMFEIADDIDDSGDDGVYEREKQVSLLILRAFRKCKFDVVEHENQHSGVRDHGDYSGSDVLYSEDDGEAMVTIEAAQLDSFVKLSQSGLVHGDCEISPKSDGTLLVTFKVNPHLRTGTAKMAEGMMKRADPWISGERSGERPKPAPKKASAREAAIKNLAAKAGVKVDMVERVYRDVQRELDMNHPNAHSILMSRVKRVLGLLS